MMIENFRKKTGGHITYLETSLGFKITNLLG